MEKVVLLKCESYEPNIVNNVIDKAFQKLGGINEFIRPGMKVLIKPNLVIKKKPEEAVTTHPEIVRAIAKMVVEAGAEVVIADSPGGLYNAEILKGIYSTCGYKSLEKITNVRLNNDFSSVEIPFEKGKVVRSLTIIKPAKEADLIINVSKLKTHMMMTYTGAVKNLFGLIPGALKAEYHIRMKEKVNFSNLLVDLCECISPQINIMDAVWAMEGEGPSAGAPRHVGLVLASTNAFALDTAATNIIGLDENDVPTIERAKERGLPANLNDIEIIGEKLEQCKIKDFIVPNKKRSITFFNNKLFDILINTLKPKVIFNHNECIGCKRCGAHCPAKAVTFKNKMPYVDREKCIRCFCCHELCPQKSIKIKRNWILKKITY